MVDVLEISIGVENHHLVARNTQRNTIDKGINDDLVPHVLALIYQCAVGLAYLVDLLAVVPNDVKVTIDFLLVLDLEVETSTKESYVDFLLVLKRLVAVPVAEFFELYRNFWGLLWRAFLDDAGDWDAGAVYSLPVDLL